MNLNQRSYVLQTLKESLPRPECGIFIGRIITVNEDRGSADVYISDLAITLTNIPFSYQNKNTNYGALFTPGEVNSYCLVVATNSGQRYILCSANIDDSNTWVRLLKGEQALYSSGKSFIKQDVGGNLILSGGLENHLIQKKDGVNSSFSIGTENKTINSSIISGMNLWNNKDMLSGTSIKLIHHAEYYSEIDNIKYYSVDEIIDGVDIDQTVKTSIISDVEDTIAKISGASGLSETLEGMKTSIKNTSLSDIAWQAAVDQVIADFSSTFKSALSGVKVVFEVGNAIDKDLNNISEVNDIVSGDYAQSDENNNLCLRMQIKDIATGVVKGFFQVDTEGNAIMNFTTLNIVGGISVNGTPY